MIESTIWIKCVKCNRKMLIEEIKNEYTTYVCPKCDGKVQVFKLKKVEQK